MGRTKGGTNRPHSTEEKLSIVQRMLAGEDSGTLSRETGISFGQICKWTRQYIKHGETSLVNKREPGNPLAKYERRKQLTPIEQLEYKIALLEREVLKKDAEVQRLKKSIELERGDARRR